MGKGTVLYSKPVPFFRNLHRKFSLGESDDVALSSERKKRGLDESFLALFPVGQFSVRKCCS